MEDLRVFRAGRFHLPPPQFGENRGVTRAEFLRCQCCGRRHGLGETCEASAEVRKEAKEFSKRFRGVR